MPKMALSSALMVCSAVLVMKSVLLLPVSVLSFMLDRVTACEGSV